MMCLCIILKGIWSSATHEICTYLDLLISIMTLSSKTVMSVWRNWNQILKTFTFCVSVSVFYHIRIRSQANLCFLHRWIHPLVQSISTFSILYQHIATNISSRHFTKPSLVSIACTKIPAASKMSSNESNPQLAILDSDNIVATSRRYASILKTMT